MSLYYLKIFGLTIFVTSLLPNFLISDALAYIDPGSGSLIIQMIVGALVGIGITIRVYWYKFKETLKRISKK